MINHVQFPALGLEFTLNRVAFSLGGLDVYWYGIILALGLLAGMAFAFRYAVDFGIDSDRLVDVVVIGTVCGVACARIYYVAFAPFRYNSLWEMIDLRDGGIAIYGAVIGAFLFGGLACLWRKVPLLPTFGIVALGHWPLGQLYEPGSLRHQHHAALGHDQRKYAELPDQLAGGPGRRGCDRGPQPAGAPHVPV